MKIRQTVEPNDPGWMLLRLAFWPQCDQDTSRREMEEVLESGGLCFVAEDLEGTPIGFAETSIRSDHVEGASGRRVPYLEGWFVTPGHRKRGIGRALMTAVENWAVEAGYHELASDTEFENSDGIRAHLGLGFREAARSVNLIKTLRER